MNQRYLLTIAAVFLSVVGSPLEGRTQTAKNNIPTAQASAAVDVVKVGEYQTEKQNTTPDTANTQIYAHSVQGRQAATLYIRSIPVLTFLSSSPVTGAETKVGTVSTTKDMSSYNQTAGNSERVASVGNVKDVSKSSKFADNPVQRATLLAAKVNNLIRDNADASQITVSWKAEKKSPVNNKAQDKDAAVDKQLERYTIKIGGKELVEINDTTKLADTTNNPARDALQATNRLRRLIGNAAPINTIANLPKLPQDVASRVKLKFKGVASWYGYDWAGNKTANGERYNPEGMTAAHRTLPLGTKVRVTNTRNGKSVVLRINDRGPYIGGRIIDVSLGAARILGMMKSGLAPVRVEVLGK
ncbi:septal ring lytic transglycosylase RlpA family protein [Okeanomitos corallinicola TIOX110]|uniref:Probable endolytic peptidoglycan transglycosylase RlpA n=1 Tax=Okeanomitos corallinicola TIOX110 TaxID=3133117 RepID=A0ABZ2UV92_9CYAN